MLENDMGMKWRKWLKINFYFKCKKCKTEISELMEHIEVAGFIEANKCGKCGGVLAQSFGIGGIQFKGKGFTKKYIG